MKKSVTVLVFALASSTATLAFACPGGKGGMGRADVNDDGKVSLQEALDLAKRRFEKKDADNNGTITQDEMKGHGHGEQFFARFDANKDGKVTLAESQAKAKEWFAQADQNKDGFVSKDEMHQARGKGQGRDKKS